MTQAIRTLGTDTGRTEGLSSASRDIEIYEYDCGQFPAKIFVPAVGACCMVLLRKSFRPCGRIWAFTFTPNYYESPIPDTRCLKRRGLVENDQAWQGSTYARTNRFGCSSTSLGPTVPNTNSFPRQATATPHQYYVENGTF